jgi:hypothetical protein
VDTGAVEMTLNPDEVDLIDSDAMLAKAEAVLREKQALKKIFRTWLLNMLLNKATKGNDRVAKKKRKVTKNAKNSSFDSNFVIDVHCVNILATLR